MVPPMSPILLILAMACGDDNAAPVDEITLDLALSDHLPTVVSASWVTPGTPSSLRLDYGEGGALDRSLELDPARTETLLVGLPPGATITAQVVATIDGQAVTSPEIAIETGPVDGELPDLTLDIAEDGIFDGGFLLTTNVQSPAAVTVIDEQGRYVWWARPEREAFISRARISHDGQTIIAQPVNRYGETEGTGLSRFDWEGNLLETIQVEDTHHDFAELPDGTLACLTHDIVRLKGEPVVGDAIVEVDPDGTQTRVWSIFDEFEWSPEVDQMANEEWSHANVIEYDEANDRYLVGFLGLGSIMAISRADYSVEWVLSGPFSDFVGDDGTGAIFGLQHGFHLLDDSILVFENGSSSESNSRAIEVAFDEDPATTASIRWTYEASPSIYAPSLGSVQRLDSGATMVDFATGGRVVVVDPDGTERWQLSSELGGAFGYAEVIDEFRAP
ncbi:MAG: hypothetical protein D6798_07945 [Deltaproteobacteria bacterium]|nr:MAG: hypothetical protein D6798_07945 [Deltaproteobacteria bacterium]